MSTGGGQGPLILQSFDHDFQFLHHLLEIRHLFQSLGNYTAQAIHVSIYYSSVTVKQFHIMLFSLDFDSDKQTKNGQENVYIFWCI